MTAQDRDREELEELKNQQGWVDYFEAVKRRTALVSWWSKDAKITRMEELMRVIVAYQEVITTFQIAAEKVSNIRKAVDSSTGLLAPEIVKSLKQNTFVLHKKPIEQVFDEWLRKEGGSDIVNDLSRWIDEFYPSVRQFAVGEYFGPFDISIPREQERWAAIFREEANRREEIVDEAQKTFVALGLDLATDDLLSSTPDKDFLKRVQKEIEQFKERRRAIEERIRRREEFYRQHLPRLIGQYENLLRKSGVLIPENELMEEARNQAFQRAEELFAEAERLREEHSGLGIKTLIRFRWRTSGSNLPIRELSSRQSALDVERLRAQGPGFREDPVGAIKNLVVYFIKKVLRKGESVGEAVAITPEPLAEESGADTTSVEEKSREEIEINNRADRARSGGLFRTLIRVISGGQYFKEIIYNVLSRGQIQIREGILAVRSLLANNASNIRKINNVKRSLATAVVIAQRAVNRFGPVLGSKAVLLAIWLRDLAYSRGLSNLGTAVLGFWGLLSYGPQGMIAGGIIGRVSGTFLKEFWSGRLRYRTFPISERLPGLKGELKGASKIKSVIAGFLGKIFLRPLVFLGLIIFLVTVIVLIVVAGLSFSLFSGFNQGQTKNTLFTLEVKATPMILPNYKEGEERVITYTIKLTPAQVGSFANEDVHIVDQIRVYQLSGHKIVREEVYRGALEVTYNFTISDASFNNSRLVSRVVVTVKGKDGESLQEIGGVSVQIGQPPIRQPFGFPVSGYITSVDGEVGFTGKAHCGTFLPSRQCVIGGLDIAVPGGTEVYSTTTGKVLMAKFDEGNCNAGMANDGSGLCKDALGGVVYVKNGPYLVAFVHLAKDGLEELERRGYVEPGDLIGKVYAGKLPTTQSRYGSPEHLHYQVLLDGVNLEFAKHSGSCLEGNLVPVVPRINLLVDKIFKCD